MTVKECLDNTRKLINYYSISGEIKDAFDPAQADYSFRALAAIDTAQKELAARRPLIRHAVFSQHQLKPKAVLAGLRRIDTEVVLKAHGAAALSMLCDGNVHAVLEKYENGQWSTIVQTDDDGHGEMKLVYLQAQTIPDEETEVRALISGEGIFVADIALYRQFPENEDIPVFGARRFHRLPDGFRRLIDCRPSGYIGKVMRSGFSAVNDDKIGFPWDFDGTVSIEYTLWPKTIDENTGMDENLELGTDAAQIIPFYAAAMLLTDEDPALAEFFLSQYTQKLRAVEILSGLSIRNTLFNGGTR